MEDKDLQNIWKKIDPEIEYKSKKDLNQLLNSKAKKTINKYIYYSFTSALISSGFITFLIITMINRWDDKLYRLNNLILCTLTLLAAISAFWSIFNLKYNRSSLPLEEWLKYKIEILSKWLNSEPILYIINFIFMLLSILSIHVYYEYKPFIEVIKNEESIYGLSFGIIIGSIAGFFVLSKIRRKHRKSLEYLKNLYKIICDSDL